MNIIAYFSASNSLSTSLRADIEDSRFWFFVLLLICTAIVAIGVIMEELVEHREDKNHPWIVKPEWHKKLARLGWVLVIVGVIGEGVFEGTTTWVDSILQEFNGTLLSMATDQARSAAYSATIAHAESVKAKEKADAADVLADKAKAKADAVGARADDLSHQLASATTQLEDVKKKRDDLENSLINLAACTAPRTLKLDAVSWANGTKTMVDPLRPFAGQKVFLEVIPNDAEARRAVLSLANALSAAGWDLGKTIIPVDGIPDGVSVQPSSSESGDLVEEVAPERFANMHAGDVAYKLIDFLQSFNWQAQNGYPTDSKGNLIKDVKVLPVGAIRIQVGLYPATEFVTPPGEKEFAATAAQFEQDREKYRKKSQAERAARDEEMLKQLTPERATAFKAVIEEWNRNEKLLSERYRGPCKPLTPLPLSF